MKTIYRAAAVLAALVAVAPAFAQQEQGQGQWQGQRMTPEQREQRMAERFKAADTNHDGKLSLEEAKAGMPMVARNFDQIDTEHTGGITFEQLMAYMKAHQGQHRHGNGGNNGNGG
ncbi:MAG TPA: EF-hand domain-containing protein [Telluria sp.]|jgi:Ca2+-binding EF-hand superfamily protein